MIQSLYILQLKMSTVLPAIGEDNATISQLKQEIAKV